MTADSAKYVAELVRAEDRDRYLTALFAPVSARQDVMTLYAANVEISKIRDAVSEPLIGQMKIEWWKNVIAAIYDGGDVPSGNPVVEELCRVIGARKLSRQNFDALLDARAEDMAEEGPQDVLALEVYAEGTSSRLIQLSLEVLGVRDAETMTAARHVGVAWALAGIIRAVLFHARANKLTLPNDLMQKYDLSGQDPFRKKNTDKLASVVADIAQVARQHLEKARSYNHKIDRRGLSPLLVGALADQYLKGCADRKYDVFDPRHALQRPSVLSLTWRAMRNRYW